MRGAPLGVFLRARRYFNSPVEKSFTVVCWDQRGTNRSFDRKIPPSSMTVEQFIADLDELVNTVCTRFGQRQVAIYGHSWGSGLEVLYAARFPERVAVYIGAGQIGSWRASEVRGMPFRRSLRIVLGGPEASMFDLATILRGMRFSQNTMWAEVSSLDLTTYVPVLHMPMFFFLGAS